MPVKDTPSENLPGGCTNQSSEKLV